nr:MAG TPA: hypothetical protein [Caudoviricetes sp.]
MLSCCSFCCRGLYSLWTRCSIRFAWDMHFFSDNATEKALEKLKTQYKCAPTIAPYK